MDFFTLIIIMAVIYLLPELLKKRKPKEYKYPPVPANSWPEAKVTPKDNIEEPLHYVPVDHNQSNDANNTVSYASTGNANTSKNAWQENLNQSMVVNGMIFAEILSPPLAKRNNRRMHIGNSFKSFK